MVAKYSMKYINWGHAVANSMYLIQLPLVILRYHSFRWSFIVLPHLFMISLSITALKVSITVLTSAFSNLSNFAAHSFLCIFKSPFIGRFGCLRSYWDFHGKTTNRWLQLSFHFLCRYSSRCFRCCNPYQRLLASVALGLYVSFNIFHVILYQLQIFLLLILQPTSVGSLNPKPLSL